MPLLAVAPLAFLFFFSGFAIAAIQYPACSSTTWQWTYNSLNQNACAVAAYMMATCNAGTYTIKPLPPGYHYTGPGGADNYDLCKCNTIAYSLLSACDGCQGSEWITWSEYVTNCTKILPPSSFPNAIPTGTRLPQWALLDVTYENNWNFDKSYTVADSPELGPGTIPGPPGSSVSTSMGPTSAYPSTSSSSSSISQGSSSISATPTPIGRRSSNTGAIAGGVAGSIASISIFIAVLLFYLRRRRPAAPPAPSAPSDPLTTDGQPGGFSPNMSQLSPRSVSGHETVASSVPETTTSLRPYNPEDPATYPTYQGASPPPTYNPFQSPSPTTSRNIYTVATSSHSQGQELGYNGLPIV